MASPDTSLSVAVRPQRRGLAITALVLGILTPASAIVTYIWAAMTPGMSAVGVLILGGTVVAAIAVVALIVGIVAVVMVPAKALPLVALGLVVATAIGIFAIFFPPSVWV